MPHRLLTQGLYILNMSDRKTIVLRLDPKKLKAIEKWAADEFRSTNGQIEFILDEALRKAGRYRGKREEGRDKEEESESIPQSPQKGD